MVNSRYNYMVVLLVEDDDSLREIFSDAFYGLGCKVLLAENGKDALEILKSNPIDFVLTDVQMPVMNGMEFLKQAKSVKSNLPPIFIMTGGCPYTEKQFYAEGAAGYFDKVGLSLTKILSLLKHVA